VSGFSSVDDSPDPAALVRFLDEAARAESGMKRYAVAAHVLRRPAGPILDVGCGAGHDLVLFAAEGLRVVGVDPSAVMVDAARTRTAGAGASVVRAVGEALPFAGDSFSGCRIERVLMHVADPLVVLAEVLRCVVSGGLVTVFEPNWASFRVRSEVLSERATWLTFVKHPDVGARLWELLDDLGCDVLDRSRSSRCGGRWRRWSGWLASPLRSSVPWRRVESIAVMPITGSWSNEGATRQASSTRSCRRSR
jgi:SAM-dependent methyltransferase